MTCVKVTELDVEAEFKLRLPALFHAMCTLGLEFLNPS